MLALPIFRPISPGVAWPAHEFRRAAFTPLQLSNEQGFRITGISFVSYIEAG